MSEEILTFSPGDDEESPKDFSPLEREILFGRDAQSAEEVFDRQTEAAMGTPAYLDGVTGAQSLDGSRLRAAFTAAHPEWAGLTEEHAERLFLQFTGEANRALQGGEVVRGRETRAQALGLIEKIMRERGDEYARSKSGDPLFHEVQRLFRLAHD